MNRNSLTDLGVYGFIVAGILVMTRPGSQGPALLSNLTNGYARIAQAVSGQAVTA